MERRKNEEEEAIKIILIGDSGTGKTNLITVSAGFEFNSNSLTTRSCSYIQKIFSYKNNKFRINMWDTIGQEKYRSLTKIFVKDSKIVLFVYDITNKKSFESLTFWKGIVDDLITDQPIFGVVGNKMDLILEEQVSEDELIKFAKSINAKHLLTSAKIDAPSFIQFTEELIVDYLQKGHGERIDSFSLYSVKDIKKKKNCC